MLSGDWNKGLELCVSIIISYLNKGGQKYYEYGNSSKEHSTNLRNIYFSGLFIKHVGYSPPAHHPPFPWRLLNKVLYGEAPLLDNNENGPLFKQGKISQSIKIIDNLTIL